MLTGCRAKYPDLTDNPIAFHTSEYTDLYDGAGYLTIEYNGRVYLPYGTLKTYLQNNSIDQCIGYIVQTEKNSSIPNENDTDYRVYTLVDDPNHQYLMVYYINSSLMNQPDFYRAMDTKNKTIKTPKYIGSLDYSFWDKRDNRKNSSNSEFFGWIVDAGDDYIIVEAEQGSYERTISNLYKMNIVRPTSGVDDFYVVGNKVKITYQGKIQETYPASIITTQIVLVGG